MSDLIKTKVTDASLKVSKDAKVREAVLQAALDKVSLLTAEEFEELTARIPGINGGMQPELIRYYPLLKRFIDVNALRPGIVGNPRGGMLKDHIHLGGNVYELNPRELRVIDAAFKKDFALTLREAGTIVFK
ncbi:MAG: hypothetical protein FWE76_06820 [Symbiobacteriaceae bacterium]|nr:hypothetical protein [Symbiobacteriaceae bacterium]